jgi:hypothetical protein
MRTFSTLALAALLTAGVSAGAMAQIHDSSNEGYRARLQEQRQTQSPTVRTDAMSANASAAVWAPSTVKPAVHFERR